MRRHLVIRKHLFDLPDGVIYLDGNSLGPLPKGAAARVAEMMREEWGGQLIGGWNGAGWMDQPARVGDRVGALIGAPAGTVMMGDTLSVKVFQALAAALDMAGPRRVILSDRGNFPTDLYMAQGLIDALGRGHKLRLVDPEEVMHAITDEVAVVMLTHVDYRTGRMHDMAEVTARAHAAGAVMIWDLAHSAGAVPVDLSGSGCAFAVGCTYKYLNGGPGAPAFVYVRADLADTVEPILAGWLGHAAPFDFDLGYRPAPGSGRLRVGTPPVLQMTALEAALSVWEGVDISELRRESMRLQEVFITQVEARVPQLRLASPRDPEARGSQVSFAFAHGYAAIQALIARGVIGDFRAPDIMRFGFTPLYLDEADVRAAVDHIEVVIRDRLWDQPEYLARKAVT
ncbi:MAG: kynureninase [Pseudomonadota bacterium]